MNNLTDRGIASYAYGWAPRGWDGEYMALCDILKDELVEMYYKTHPDMLEEAMPSLYYYKGIDALTLIYEDNGPLVEAIKECLYKDSEDALRSIIDDHFEELRNEDTDSWAD